METNHPVWSSVNPQAGGEGGRTWTPTTTADEHHRDAGERKGRAVGIGAGEASLWLEVRLPGP